MKEHIGKIVEVGDNKNEGVKLELLAVLPEDITYRYITRNEADPESYAEWKYARPIPEEIYYYQYEKKRDGYIEVSTSYCSDDNAKGNGFTEENGWYKIESSKRKWEH